MRKFDEMSLWWLLISWGQDWMDWVLEMMYDRTYVCFFLIFIHVKL